MCPKTVHFDVKIIRKRKRSNVKQKKTSRKIPPGFPNNSKVYKYKINQMLEADSV